jgi:hypothetical protein
MVRQFELKIDVVKCTQDKLYKSALKLFSREEDIEDFLSAKINQLFDLEYKIIIYDLTNTYFEGRKSHRWIAKFGRSKEKTETTKRSEDKKPSLSDTDTCRFGWKEIIRNPLCGGKRQREPFILENHTISNFQKILSLKQLKNWVITVNFAAILLSPITITF